MEDVMAFAFGRATPSLRQPPSRCLDNPVPGNIIFSLNGEHHLLLKVLHFRVDKRSLKKQLRRKEKALAEAAALLILKKKVDQLWETEEVD